MGIVVLDMDWIAFDLSLRLAICTTAVLIVLGLAVARLLAWSRFPGRYMVEAVVALPLGLPPTVLGYYLLLFLGRESPVGRLVESLTGETLVFSFSGLVVAAVIYSVSFAVQPILQAFESIPRGVREAAWCSGLSRWETFWRIELPLARKGLISVAIFDSVQSFDDSSAGTMSMVLLLFSFLIVSFVFVFNHRRKTGD